MKGEFPDAVPEIPVSDVHRAVEYYKNSLGFNLDWGGDEGGIAGISKGRCRLFLSNPAFRQAYGNSGPVLVWINLRSRAEVLELHRDWSRSGTKLVSAPEAKAWKLFEFTAADLDGNLLRVFYDFAWEASEGRAHT